MSYDDDHDQGYWDGNKYMFPRKSTELYINGWWDGKESRDLEDYDQFLVYDMENEDE